MIRRLIIKEFAQITVKLTLDFRTVNFWAKKLQLSIKKNYKPVLISQVVSYQIYMKQYRQETKLAYTMDFKLSATLIIRLQVFSFNMSVSWQKKT